MQGQAARVVLDPRGTAAPAVRGHCSLSETIPAVIRGSLPWLDLTLFIWAAQNLGFPHQLNPGERGYEGGGQLGAQVRVSSAVYAWRKIPGSGPDRHETTQCPFQRAICSIAARSCVVHAH